MRTLVGRAALGYVCRAVGAFLTLVLSGGTGFVGLVFATIIYYNNCEDGCRPGSPFALGAWGTVVELWGLYIPALVMAAVLVVTIAAGWQRVAQAAWIAMTALLVTWSVFTFVIVTPLGLLGLLISCGGALYGVLIAFPGPLQTARGTRPSMGP